MSFIIKTFLNSDEDTLLSSLYKDNKYCKKRDVTTSHSLYIFDSIDSFFAKQLLWECNKNTTFDMSKIVILNE